MRYSYRQGGGLHHHRVRSAFAETPFFRSDELIFRFRLSRDYYGQGSFFRHCEERHKLYYLRDMMPDELLLLRCFDSSLGGFVFSSASSLHTDLSYIGVNEGGTTPHTAIMDEERKHLSLRQSVEVRCAVLY
jgi:hypothetical protein